ncbi:hypothetical protein AMK26_03895 [Streptomyces sp. CB03234]|uniref:hypothetical protein n=1 Tax=Streptomyces sp. (strain CB03234) TaxID=1703937 RepID=UPI000939A6F9|nr:hypothetical protein [Streptomyces sp. CB03234]OKK08174.1 hypothetical protein AMK26_03895 [Streptomyces sp. CB03234]
MNTRTKLAALALTAGVVTATGGATAPAAVALTTPAAHSVVQPAAATPADNGDVRAAGSGSADRTLRTSNGAGSVRVKWTWHSSANGKSYYGSFWGTFYDHAPKDKKYVLLQAKWQGKGWTTIRTAAKGGTFSGDYSGLKGLNFRACLQGGKCGAPAW